MEQVLDKIYLITYDEIRAKFGISEQIKFIIDDVSNEDVNRVKVIV